MSFGCWFRECVSYANLNMIVEDIFIDCMLTVYSKKDLKYIYILTIVPVEYQGCQLS